MNPISEVFLLEYETCSNFIKTQNTDASPAFVSQPRGLLTSEQVISLHPGHILGTPPVRLSPEHVLVLGFSGIPQSNNEASLSLVARDENNTVVFSSFYSLQAAREDKSQTVSISLAPFAGKTCQFEISVDLVETKPTLLGRFMKKIGAQSPAVGLSKLMIGRQSEMGKLVALSNYEWRLKNEIGHFSGAAYTHSMYGEAKSPSKAMNLERHESGTGVSSFLEDQERKLREKVRNTRPHPDEAVFSYAQRCLGNLIPLSAPDFYGRAETLSQNKSLNILSLCSGAARIEEEILKHCKSPATITLLDASEDLLQRAAARLEGEGHNVRCLVGDINNGLPGDDLFDVIVCVSALHHVANLELVLSQINERLTADGEFWNIGEQVGMNGNRLWPRTLAAANTAFKKLPDRLRKHARSGKIHHEVPDDDFSLGCFEGIRSGELCGMLENYLIPVNVYKRNCFLWRLTDTAYCDNYNLKQEEDVAHLQELVIAEALHWVSGGPGTELHAIYRKKHFL